LLRDWASAEDMLQQTFLKLHSSRSSYILGADPVPWLYAIAHRTGLDEIRRRRRSRIRLERRGEGPLEIEAALCGKAVESLAREAFGERARTRALAALDDLPDEQRTAVVLTKLHGMSSAQAAAVLGISAGAVKQRVHRAYVSLRDNLAEDLDVETRCDRSDTEQRAKGA
jgi:RNA polymerase sigma-70 factor (ECF subfamily)